MIFIKELKYNRYDHESIVYFPRIYFMDCFTRDLRNYATMQNLEYTIILTLKL